MPRLDRLTVRGFKSIRKLEDFELGSLNVLIGPNGAGKTNFLDLFRMLDSLEKRRLQVFVGQHGGPDSLLFGGTKRTGQMDFGLHFGNSMYAFSLTPVANNRMVFLREFVRTASAGHQSLSSGHFESNLASAQEGAEKILRPYMGTAVPAWRVYHFLDTSPAAAVRLAQKARDNLSLKKDAGNLGPILRRLRERFPESYRKIVDVVRLAAPFFGDFVYRKDAGEQMQLEWSSSGNSDTVFGPQQLSDGTLRFISLATLLMQPTELQPELILIDEPELGLHPFALTLLAEMLKDASHTRQVIFSTQSADLVSEFDPEDVVVVDRKEGASTFTRLDGERLSEWLEDYALGDLWKMNIVGGRPKK